MYMFDDIIPDANSQHEQVNNYWFMVSLLWVHTHKQRQNRKPATAADCNAFRFRTQFQPHFHPTSDTCPTTTQRVGQLICLAHKHTRTRYHAGELFSSECGNCELAVNLMLTGIDAGCLSVACEFQRSLRKRALWLLLFLSAVAGCQQRFCSIWTRSVCVNHFANGIWNAHSGRSTNGTQHTLQNVIK